MSVVPFTAALHVIQYANTCAHYYQDSKVYGVNMGPTWVLSALGGSHVGLMNLAIWVRLSCDLAQADFIHILQGCINGTEAIMRLPSAPQEETMQDMDEWIIWVRKIYY